MTFRNDPNRRDMSYDDGANYTPWVFGALAAMAVIFGIVFTVTPKDATVATIERPAVSAPATTSLAPAPSTTGSAVRDR